MHILKFSEFENNSTQILQRMTTITFFLFNMLMYFNDIKRDYMQGKKKKPT